MSSERLDTSVNATMAATPEGSSSQYVMRVSRMTIDKLGVRLYDTVSAVVAELIANGYDADAMQVTVRVPLGLALARRVSKSKDDWTDLGHTIEVVDNGHGMSRDEANENFLKVGRERRTHPGQGPRSRKLSRRVMGRKGIGKLAPFGICRRIEVISAGSAKTEQGYPVSHFVMDYSKIVADNDEPVALDAGNLDGTYLPETGTTVRLSSFLGKRVPDATVFLRQLARRFTPTAEFSISVEDTNPSAAEGERNHIIGPLNVPIQENTKVDVTNRPVRTENGEELPVKGWLALAKDAYKDEETAGVRIYARNKIVGWTRDFEQPAGYTGEFTIRSYLVGEVTAEWLDLDEGDDLVRTDRQGIIWDSEYGSAFKKWGANLIKEIGTESREPRRSRVRQLFLSTSRIEELARRRYKDEGVVTAAIELANKIGGFAAEDELTDQGYLDDLSSIILSVAPHTALMQAFEEVEKLSERSELTIENIQALLGKTRVAELASYGQIAHERLKTIEKLEKIVREKTPEPEFQQLIASAPWLVEPTWSIISENRSLKTFKDQFELWFKRTYDRDITLAIQPENKRPDFTLVEIGQRLHVVEIKASEHVFDNADYERLENYATAFDQFFATHETVRESFPLGYLITVVTDGVNLSGAAKRAFDSLVTSGKLHTHTWFDFLNRTRQAHDQFLRTSDAVQGQERGGSG